MGLFTDAISGVDPSVYADALADRISLSEAVLGNDTIADIQYSLDHAFDEYNAMLAESISISGDGAAGSPLPSAKETSKISPSQNPRNLTEKRQSKGNGQGKGRTGQQQQKTRQQKAAERAIKTETESMLLKAFWNVGITSSFESELLDGRVELGGVRTSFVVGNKAVRLFDQNDSRRILEKIQLEGKGFKVLDISPARVSSRITLKDVIGSLLEEF